jgi:hypothetical protein
MTVFLQLSHQPAAVVAVMAFHLIVAVLR